MPTEFIPKWLSQNHDNTPITFAWELEGKQGNLRALYFYYPVPTTPTPSGDQNFTDPNNNPPTTVPLTPQIWFGIEALDNSLEALAKLLIPQGETYNEKTLFTDLATYKQKNPTFLLKKWDKILNAPIMDKNEKLSSIIWNNTILENLHYELLMEPDSNRWEMVTKALNWETFEQTIRTVYPKQNNPDNFLGAFHTHLVFHAPPTTPKDKFDNWAQRIAYFYEYMVIATGLYTNSLNITSRLYGGKVITELANDIQKHKILEIPHPPFGNRSNYKFICIGFRQTYKNNPENPADIKNPQLFGFEFRSLHQSEHHTTSKKYLDTIMEIAKVLNDNPYFLDSIWTPSSSNCEGLLKAIFADEFEDLRVIPITTTNKTNQVAVPSITPTSITTILNAWNQDLKTQLETTYAQGDQDIITFRNLWSKIKETILDNRNLPKEEIRSIKPQKLTEKLQKIIEQAIDAKLEEDLKIKEELINDKGRTIQKMLKKLLYKNIPFIKIPNANFQNLIDNFTSFFYHYLVELVPLLAQDWLRLIIFWRERQWGIDIPQSPLQQQIQRDYQPKITLIETIINTLTNTPPYSYYYKFKNVNTTTNRLSSPLENKSQAIDREKFSYSLPFKTWENHPAIPPNLTSRIQQARATYAESFPDDLEATLKEEWDRHTIAEESDYNKSLDINNIFTRSFAPPLREWIQNPQMAHYLQIDYNSAQPTLYYGETDSNNNPIPFTRDSLQYLPPTHTASSSSS